MTSGILAPVLNEKQQWGAGMRRSMTIIIVGTIGGLLTIASIVIDGRVTANELGRIGGMLCVAAFIAAMWRRTGRAQALYELGYNDGEASTLRYAADEREKGFREGRRIARPVALPTPADSWDDRAASSTGA